MRLNLFVCVFLRSSSESVSKCEHIFYKLIRVPQFICSPLMAFGDRNVCVPDDASHYIFTYSIDKLLLIFISETNQFDLNFWQHSCHYIHNRHLLAIADHHRHSVFAHVMDKYYTHQWLFLEKQKIK